MARREISNRDDLVDSRAVLTRVEELESERDDHYESSEQPWSSADFDAAQELEQLTALVAELRGVGGDRPEDGQTLIRENYLSDYVKELYLECTDQDLLRQVQEQLEGPWNHVDWAAVAEDERSDYTEVTWAGVTYYVR